MELHNEYHIFQNWFQESGVDIQRKDIKLEFDDVERFSSWFDFESDGLKWLLHDQNKTSSTSSDENITTLSGVGKN